MSKVLFIHHSGLIGGAGVSLFNVVNTIAQHDDVYVALSTDPEDMLELFEPLVKKFGIHIIPYGRRIGAITYYSGGDSCFSLRFYYRVLLVIKQIKYWNNRIKEINPDIVVVNSKTTSWISRLSEVKNRKSICFVRETTKGNRYNLLNSYIANCLDGFSKVVFLSNYDRNRERLKKAQTEVIYNYVADNQFDNSISRTKASRRLSISEDTVHILYVGGVSEIKGFDIAVRAVLSCPYNTQLIIAGNDFSLAADSKDKKTRKYVEYWKEYILHNDKHHQIYFVGKQQDMSACYSCADIVLFPMREPHQARPAFEAGYFKKPIIITDFDNIHEFVIDGYNGLLANNENIEEFKECIIRLESNIDYCVELGKNNYLNTMKNHNQTKISQKLFGLIKDYS